MLGSYKVLIVLVVGELVIMAFYTLLVCGKKRVAVLPFVKKLIPTFLIAVTTSSSSAAFATNMDTCQKKLGIDAKITNFGIPLGQVIFMPGAAVQFLATALCMAETYGVDITPAWLWLVTAFLITAILGIAAPPIPGGALTCYTILFIQLGIPTEAIAITIILNVILEFLGTAANLYCLQCELTLLADDLDMLDEAALKGS